MSMWRWLAAIEELITSPADQLCISWLTANAGLYIRHIRTVIGLIKIHECDCRHKLEWLHSVVYIMDTSTLASI